MLYGKEEILKELPNQNHEFLNGKYPYTINPGGPNHEELVSLIGIYEYFEGLYNHHFENKKIKINNKIKNINELISLHEEEIANPILKYLDDSENFKLIGKNKISNKNRAPTISFTSKKMSSKMLSKKLVDNQIATRNDNFYAWRCLKALGIDADDGVVRISLAHYNSIEETKKLIKVFDKI